MRAFSELFSILFIGLFVGGLLAWLSIQNNHGFGTLTIGQWTAWPLAGSQQADPYSKAKVAADGDVPLGAAEGLAFHAQTDERGNPLQRNCQYRIRGTTPTARLWTLAAHDLKDRVLFIPDGLPSSPPSAPHTVMLSLLMVLVQGRNPSWWSCGRALPGNVARRRNRRDTDPPTPHHTHLHLCHSRHCNQSPLAPY